MGSLAGHVPRDSVSLQHQNKKYGENSSFNILPLVKCHNAYIGATWRPSYVPGYWLDGWNSNTCTGTVIFLFTMTHPYPICFHDEMLTEIYMLSVHVWAAVRPGLFGTQATIGPTVPGPYDDNRYMCSIWRAENWQGKQKYSKKTNTVPFCLPQIPHVLTWDVTGPRGEKPTTNHLSYSMTIKIITKHPYSSFEYVLMQTSEQKIWGTHYVKINSHIPASMQTSCQLFLPSKQHTSFYRNTQNSHIQNKIINQQNKQNRK
jgi:hypothetical protein